MPIVVRCLYFVGLLHKIYILIAISQSTETGYLEGCNRKLNCMGCSYQSIDDLYLGGTLMLFLTQKQTFSFSKKKQKHFKMLGSEQLKI